MLTFTGNKIKRPTTSKGTYLAKPFGVKVAVICKERDCTLSSHHRTSIVARAVRKNYAEKIPETKQQ
jgi:hypothetical protein